MLSRCYLFLSWQLLLKEHLVAEYIITDYFLDDGLDLSLRPSQACYYLNIRSRELYFHPNPSQHPTHLVGIWLSWWWPMRNHILIIMLPPTAACICEDPCAVYSVLRPVWVRLPVREHLHYHYLYRGAGRREGNWKGRNKNLKFTKLPAVPFRKYFIKLKGSFKHALTTFKVA